MTTVDCGPVSLRGHHLVCIEFLHGQGYSLEFARNILHLREQFEREGALVVTGHDDVCLACPRNHGHTCLECPDNEDHIGDLDGLAYELLHVSQGERIGAKELLDRISMILPLWRERACTRCAWVDVCASSIDLLSRG